MMKYIKEMNVFKAKPIANECIMSNGINYLPIIKYNHAPS